MITTDKELDEMNLFVSTTFFKDGTAIETALDTCKINGIKNLELGSNHQYSSDFKSIITSLSPDLTYLVHNYFPIPKESFVLNLASTDEHIIQRSLEHVHTAIDFCEETGALLYTFHPGFLTDPKGSNQNRDNYDFQWDDAAGKQYDVAYETMLESIETCVEYAAKKKIRIAIETEGSYNKHHHLLMQKPAEYEKLFKYFSPADLGINLNIGHLKLATEVFGFTAEAFTNLIGHYIVAMELSHNNGLTDQHLPLAVDAWYWPIILQPQFKNAYKILEFRDTSVERVQANIDLYKSKYYGV
ncbi:MAG: hypothetical protein EPO58_12245 [Chitinophagaceae bacterium]|nr:MAG: hypothetical protein EPO58_12245 [Chitinophagaceae bacterium]